MCDSGDTGGGCDSGSTACDSGTTTCDSGSAACDSGATTCDSGATSFTTGHFSESTCDTSVYIDNNLHNIATNAHHHSAHHHNNDSSWFHTETSTTCSSHPRSKTETSYCCRICIYIFAILIVVGLILFGGYLVISRH